VIGIVTIYRNMAPFTNVPIGGNIDIGEQVPRNAYVESAYISMPYHIGLTRDQVEEIIDEKFNNSELGNLTFALDEIKTIETARVALENEISILSKMQLTKL